MKAYIDNKLKPILWIVWGSLFMALFVYREFLLPNPDSNGTSFPVAFMLAMLVIPSLISIFMRWVVLPRVPEAQMVLVASIIGIAMGESLTFYGMFLFRDTFEIFFYTSILMVLQFIPIYLFKLSSAPPTVKDLSQSS